MKDFRFTSDLLSILRQSDGILHDRKDDGTYHKWSASETEAFLNNWMSIMRENGIGKGDRIMLMPAGASARWVLLDLLAQALGLEVVLVHAGIHAREFSIISDQSKARLIVSSSDSIMETDLTVCNINHSSATSISNCDTTIDRIPDEVCSIICTSGSSGLPKGVKLTHQNIMSNVRAISLLMPIEPIHCCLSFLPYSHAFERTIVYAYILRRTKLFFIHDARNLGEAFAEVRPHFVTAVPRVLERMYSQVVGGFERSNVILRRLFHYALVLTKNYEPHKAGVITHLQVLFVRHILLRRFRKKLGGRLIAMLVGAAHLRPIVARSFAAIGVKVREGYGMTEASPVITVNRFEPGLHKLGTVGLPLPGVQVRISTTMDDQSGEIEFRGPNLMKGYLADDELKANRMTADGYFKTGDVGYFDKDGFLVISDRVKDIFKTSTGEYISPAQLSNHFLASRYIKDILIIGFQRPFVAALILPDMELLKKWAMDMDVHWTSEQYMVHNLKIRELLDQEIQSLNHDLPNHKKLRAFHLMYQPFSENKGEVSRTMKPIRKIILANYAKEIDKLYQQGS